MLNEIDTVRILIVEYDPDIAQRITLQLRDVGYQVNTKDDGMTGLKRATSGHYALIGLDVVLAGLSGTELCQQLRAKDSDTLF